MALQNNNLNNRNSQLSLSKANIAHLPRRPFWLPAISYYFLAISTAITAFFIVWGILIEGDDAAPWIPAGIISSGILIGAFVLREIFLRKARLRYLIAKRQLDFNLSHLPNKHKAKVTNKIKKREKFTVKQNTFMLNQIKEKSDAARVLKRLPQGHLDVLEICVEYLNFTKKELKYIDVNSPRFKVVRKSQTTVKKAHKYHLIKWAEIESKKFTQESKSRITTVNKVESAKKAMNVLETALKFYPKERQLEESFVAISEYVSSLKIRNLMEKAEKSVFRREYTDALDQYRDILFYIENEDVPYEERSQLLKQVNNEIFHLENLLNKNLINNQHEDN